MTEQWAENQIKAMSADIARLTNEVAELRRRLEATERSVRTVSGDAYQIENALSKFFSSWEESIRP